MNMPPPIVLGPGVIGLQITNSNLTYGLLNFTGGYQAVLFSGNVSNVTIDGLKCVNPQYGIYQSRGAGGVQDGLVFHDIDISMPDRGEHCWRIYGARNQRAYRTRLVNYGVKFTGTTLALKEAEGMLWVDTFFEGLGPAFGPLPLPSEKDYLVKDVMFLNANAILTSPLEISGGCVNLTFSAYPGKRCTIKQTSMSKPVLNFPDHGHPLAIGTSFTGYDFTGGSALYAGNPNGALFPNCTYNGHAV